MDQKQASEAFSIHPKREWRIVQDQTLIRDEQRACTEEKMMPVILKEMGEGDYLPRQPGKRHFDLLQNLDKLWHDEGEDYEHEGDRRPDQNRGVNQGLLDICVQFIQPVDIPAQLCTNLRQCSALFRHLQESDRYWRKTVGKTCHRFGKAGARLYLRRYVSEDAFEL